MPLIENSTYQAPPLFNNGHVQTSYPTLFRKVKPVHYQRERIYTPDDDFIDLDWSRVGSKNAVIISPGLEASSEASYIKGMTHAFNRRGWDGAVFNFRGCSGETNRLLRSYHSGASDDLHTVICHIIAHNPYEKLALIGFSLGGNLTLKYLGERGAHLFPVIQSAVTISVPCDLRSSALRLAESDNRLYMKRFLIRLNKRVKEKIHLMIPPMTYEGFKSIKTFQEFDGLYTAPAHGFLSAEDYWTRCSSRQFIPRIGVPTLLINALDDPFLGKECFPREEAEKNPLFFLEMPSAGGHVGFVTFNSQGEYWHETRAASFIINGCN